jgi:hypothetical protein
MADAVGPLLLQLKIALIQFALCEESHNGAEDFFRASFFKRSEEKRRMSPSGGRAVSFSEVSLSGGSYGAQQCFRLLLQTAGSSGAFLKGY